MANALKIGSKFITANGKRVGVNYFAGPWVAGVNPDLIKIRARRGASLAALREHFAIENNSDMTTDYFEADCIRVLPGHQHYDAVRAAIAAA